MKILSGDSNVIYVTFVFFHQLSSGFVNFDF